MTVVEQGRYFLNYEENIKRAYSNTCFDGKPDVMDKNEFDLLRVFVNVMEWN